MKKCIPGISAYRCSCRTSFIFAAASIGSLCSFGLFDFSEAFAESSPAGGNVFTLEEVAKHNSSKSCYLVIQDVVYDATAIMKEHASKHDYDLTKWCGKEATKGWTEKGGKGKPHSRKAGIQLKPLRIGTVATPTSKP